MEINRQRGRKKHQKRPNYKNVGEEEEDEKLQEDSKEDLDKGKPTDSASKGIKATGDTEG